jgi:hypothetical protein
VQLLGDLADFAAVLIEARHDLARQGDLAQQVGVDEPQPAQLLRALAELDVAVAEHVVLDVALLVQDAELVVPVDQLYPCTATAGVHSCGAPYSTARTP